MNYVLALKHYFDALDPKLWYLCILALTVGLMELWRTQAPVSFAKVPSKLKALPPLLLATVVNASASDNLRDLVVNALIGTLLGLTAVGGYEAKVRLLSGVGSRDPKPEPTSKAEPRTDSETKENQVS